jgi:hypothetical protein
MRIEHELSPIVKKWLKGTKRSPYTAQQTVGQVMKSLPETGRGRRRRWSFPWRSRSSTTASRVAPQDLQPSPISATNGHTPTVTGRTHSMFSPAKAITAGALVFAIGGAFLIAQPFDQQGVTVPGAATDGAGLEPAKVTGTISGWDEIEVESEGSIEDGFIRDQWEERAQLEMSDSRLTGTLTGTLGIDRYSPNASGDGIAETFTGTVSVENDGGTWVGTQFGCECRAPSSQGSDMFHMELVGTGAYEGLSALLYLQNPRINDEDDLYGVIFPGDIPSGQ